MFIIHVPFLGRKLFLFSLCVMPRNLFFMRCRASQEKGSHFFFCTICTYCLSYTMPRQASFDWWRDRLICRGVAAVLIFPGLSLFRSQLQIFLSSRGRPRSTFESKQLLEKPNCQKGKFELGKRACFMPLNKMLIFMMIILYPRE